MLLPGWAKHPGAVDAGDDLFIGQVAVVPVATEGGFVRQAGMVGEQVAVGDLLVLLAVDPVVEE